MLPFCQVTLLAQKSLKTPQNPKTLGDHLRKKRLEENLFQKDVAKLIGVTECTIYNWENDYSYPQLMHFPSLIHFLGYNPIDYRDNDFVGRIIHYRKCRGLSRRKLASILRIDESTLARWETRKGIPSKGSKKRLSKFFKDILGEKINE